MNKLFLVIEIKNLKSELIMVQAKKKTYDYYNKTILTKYIKYYVHNNKYII